MVCILSNNEKKTESGVSWKIHNYLLIYTAIVIHNLCFICCTLSVVRTILCSTVLYCISICVTLYKVS